MLLRFSPKVDHVKCVVISPVEGLAVEKTLVQLLPGVNEVTEGEWQGMRPNIAKEIESGEITILAQKVSDGRGKPGGRKAKDLTEMPVNIAVNYVNECENPETLKKWYLEEVREEVRVSIMKKMEKLGIEKPEDKIPDAPNASPMSLDEYDGDEDDNCSNEDEGNDVDDEISLETLSYRELVEKANAMGIAGAASMKKANLIDAIKAKAEEDDEE